MTEEQINRLMELRKHYKSDDLVVLEKEHVKQLAYLKLLIPSCSEYKMGSLEFKRLESFMYLLRLERDLKKGK